MQRFNRLAFLLLACCSYFFSTAQTTHCSADFTYTVGNNKTAQFISADSLGVVHRWLFGDGTNTLITGNGIVEHQYAQTGQYEVKHIIEKPNSNCRDTVIKVITVEWLDQCRAGFSYQKITGTLSYQFYNSSSSYAGIKKTTWNFGDGSSSDAINPVHNFQPGSYTICLRIESNDGCTSEHCEPLQVIDSAGTCTISASYSYRKDDQDCKKIYFINQSSPISPNVHFAWKFGDGTSSNDTNPVHIYTQPGKYYVCLVTEAGTNCRKEYCDSVTVNCGTACNITAKYEYRKDSSDCRKIHFINLSTPVSPNIHFAWKFGDGASSNDINPVHIYTQVGKYYVCLVIEADTNCRKEYCDSVTVNCETACNITTKYEYRKDSSDCRKIHFINLSTPVSPNIHFAWKFGDGEGSYDTNPVHVYSQPGKYQVCLVADAGNGCTKYYCDSVTVRCETTCNVLAKFEIKHDADKWNTLHFNNVSQPVSNIWQTYWTYGDGASSHDYNSFHSYENPGIYQVCLKVISLNGCSSVYCDTVRVTKPDSCDGKARFSTHGASTNPLTVRFEALYQSNTAKYYWNFGDNIGGTGRNTYHVYSQPGTYKVCLTVKDGDCFVSSCKEITVSATGVTPGRLILSPNPAISTVSLDVTLDRPGLVLIRLLDGSGALKAEYSKSGSTGNNRFTLPVERLARGLYLVQVKTSNGIWFSRFLKA